MQPDTEFAEQLTAKLLECGVDISTPQGVLDFQADLKFLRTLRNMVERKLALFIMTAIASTIVSAIGGSLWVALHG